MNRRRADLAVGALVVAILAVGWGITWQAYRQQRAVAGMMGSMMGPSTGAVHGPNPLWYGLGTVLAAAVVVGLYLVVRNDLAGVAPGAGDAGVQARAEPTGEDGPDPSTPDVPAAVDSPDAAPERRVLDLLPADERRVLAPVIESPGITQIELRDRSSFSKSKVSQTVSALEKRGLLYRERQGRTYRVYPSDDLHERAA